MLYKLIYASRPRISGEADIEEILAASRRNNPQKHVTGMLLFNRDWFVQLLEGTRAATTERFLQISADPRHDGIELMAFRATPFRLFADWSMHYVPSLTPSSGALLKYFPSGRFDPAHMTAETVEHLWSEVAALSRTANVAAAPMASCGSRA